MAVGGSKPRKQLAGVVRRESQPVAPCSPVLSDAELDVLVDEVRRQVESIGHRLRAHLQNREGAPGSDYAKDYHTAHAIQRILFEPDHE